MPETAISNAEWKGSVQASLATLKDAVRELQSNSATKTDITSAMAQMQVSHTNTEQMVQLFKDTIKESMDALPCTVTAAKLERHGIALAQLSVAFKIKSSLWGLLGGLVPIVLALAYIAIQTAL